MVEGLEIDVRQTMLFAGWLAALRDKTAAARISKRIARLQGGLLGGSRIGDVTMPLETIPFDAAEYITTPEDQADLLTNALASGSAAYIANALGIIARARGMGQVARDSGVTRAGLYKALGQDGDPRLTTLLGVMKALGIKLVAQPA
jgi:probable addiction module antidote protein